MLAFFIFIFPQCCLPYERKTTFFKLSRTSQKHSCEFNGNRCCVTRHAGLAARPLQYTYIKYSRASTAINSAVFRVNSIVVLEDILIGIPKAVDRMLKSSIAKEISIFLRLFQWQ